MITIFHTISISPPVPSAPIDVRIRNTSSSSVFVDWAPSVTPNGIITHYTVYINLTNSSSFLTATSSATNFMVFGLQPHQMVVVQVSASTIAGDGPLSDLAEGRSSEEGLQLLNLVI